MRFIVLSSELPGIRTTGSFLALPGNAYLAALHTVS
jgi:hypothetical protein